MIAMSTDGQVGCSELSLGFFPNRVGLTNSTVEMSSGHNAFSLETSSSLGVRVH